MTTTSLVTLPATAWKPLPGGWVLTDFTQAGHLVPMVPRLNSDAVGCMAGVPIHLPLWCSRRDGHGGRHAACVRGEIDRTLRVVAVWKEATQ